MESMDLAQLLPCARFNRALDFRRLDDWTSRRSRRMGHPMRMSRIWRLPRHYETWIPVTKFKHGKWKVKWKRYHRPFGGEDGDEDRQANEPGWNPYNQD